jgi:hypothetical protein
MSNLPIRVLGKEHSLQIASPDSMALICIIFPVTFMTRFVVLDERIGHVDDFESHHFALLDGRIDHCANYDHRASSPCSVGWKGSIIVR